MPRKPTLHVRRAREKLVIMCSQLAKDVPLPSLGVLAEQFHIHPATVFRILRDLVDEGVYWQSPKGKFFPAAARRRLSEGAPVCFIGRELWQWSRLYQEILEGISEVCAANESPLIVLSSRSLVRQESPIHPPTFASPKTQSKELARLLPLLPRGCLGIILDHVWSETSLANDLWPSAERIQLLSGANKTARMLGPDWAHSAQIVRDHVLELSPRRLGLIRPFKGDPAIDASFHILKTVLADLHPTIVEFAPDLQKNNREPFDVLICPEDNIAQEIASRLQTSRHTRIFGTQGTGVLHSPHTRLRYDYRRLGRSIASYLLHGTTPPACRPTFIDPSRTEEAKDS